MDEQNLHFVALNWSSLAFMKVETAFCSCIINYVVILDLMTLLIQGHVIGKHVEATILCDNSVTWLIQEINSIGGLRPSLH